MENIRTFACELYINLIIRTGRYGGPSHSVSFVPTTVQHDVHNYICFHICLWLANFERIFNLISYLLFIPEYTKLEANDPRKTVDHERIPSVKVDNCDCLLALTCPKAARA
jgi:hypothetical protein